MKISDEIRNSKDVEEYSTSGKWKQNGKQFLLKSREKLFEKNWISRLNSQWQRLKNIQLVGRKSKKNQIKMADNETKLVDLRGT